MAPMSWFDEKVAKRTVDLPRTMKAQIPTQVICNIIPRRIFFRSDFFIAFSNFLLNNEMKENKCNKIISGKKTN